MFTVYSTPSLPGWATHWPPVMNCHSTYVRKASHMPPWHPARPTPAGYRFGDRLHLRGVISPMVQMGTIRS